MASIQFKFSQRIHACMYGYDEYVILYICSKMTGLVALPYSVLVPYEYESNILVAVPVRFSNLTEYIMQYIQYICKVFCTSIPY